MNYSTARQDHDSDTAEDAKSDPEDEDWFLSNKEKNRDEEDEDEDEENRDTEIIKPPKRRGRPPKLKKRRRKEGEGQPEKITETNSSSPVKKKRKMANMIKEESDQDEEDQPPLKVPVNRDEHRHAEENFVGYFNFQCHSCNKSMYCGMILLFAYFHMLNFFKILRSLLRTRSSRVPRMFSMHSLARSAAKLSGLPLSIPQNQAEQNCWRQLCLICTSEIPTMATFRKRRSIMLQGICG